MILLNCIQRASEDSEWLTTTIIKYHVFIDTRTPVFWKRLFVQRKITTVFSFTHSFHFSGDIVLLFRALDFIREVCATRTTAKP